MDLKERWLRCLPAGLLLAALVMSIVWFVQPRAFLQFAPLNDATEIHIYTTDEETRPTQEEMKPLLEALTGARVKLTGRSRSIWWQREDTLYSFFAGHGENGTWVVDADFDLCTDGYLYVYKEWIGYLRYQLIDCDMERVNTVLAELVGMETVPGE